MKKTILLLVVMLFISLGLSAGTLPSDNISFGRALQHCFSTGSYITWLVICGVIFTGGLVYLVKETKKKGWTVGKQVILFVLAAILLTSFLYRPAEVAANTTNEQADRGVYIGY